MSEYYTVEESNEFHRNKDNLLKWFDAIQMEFAWVEDKLASWKNNQLDEDGVVELHKALDDTERLEKILSTLNYLYDELKVDEVSEYLSDISL